MRAPKSVRVLFDATSIPAQPCRRRTLRRGCARRVRDAIGAASTSSWSPKPEDVAGSAHSDSRRSRLRRAPHPPSQRLLWEQFGLPGLAKRLGCTRHPLAALHVPAGSRDLRRVVTHPRPHLLHDARGAHPGEGAGVPVVDPPRRAHSASASIAVSQATADEFVRIARRRPRAHHGCAPRLRPRGVPPADLRRSRSVRERRTASSRTAGSRFSARSSRARTCRRSSTRTLRWLGGGRARAHRCLSSPAARAGMRARRPARRGDRSWRRHPHARLPARGRTSRLPRRCTRRRVPESWRGVRPARARSDGQRCVPCSPPAHCRCLRSAGTRSPTRKRMPQPIARSLTQPARDDAERERLAAAGIERAAGFTWDASAEAHARGVSLGLTNAASGPGTLRLGDGHRYVFSARPRRATCDGTRTACGRSSSQASSATTMIACATIGAEAADLDEQRQRRRCSPRATTSDTPANRSKSTSTLPVPVTR